MRRMWWLALVALAVLTGCGRKDDGKGGADYQPGPQGAQAKDSTGAESPLMQDTYHNKVTNGTTPLGSEGVGTAGSGTAGNGTNSAGSAESRRPAPQ